MTFREASVVQVKELLRLWLKGSGERTIAESVGIDRKTVRRHAKVAKALGLTRSGSHDQITDQLIGQLVERVRPHRPDGHGDARRLLLREETRIQAWVDQDLIVIPESVPRNIFGNHDLGDPAEELEGGDVRPHPVDQCLAAQRFGVEVVAGAEHRHEELGLEGDLQGRLVVDGDGETGKVDEELIKAFEVAERSGSEAIGVDGELVDYAILKRARRLLEGIQE